MNKRTNGSSLPFNHVTSLPGFYYRPVLFQKSQHIISVHDHVIHLAIYQFKNLSGIVKREIQLVQVLPVI